MIGRWLLRRIYKRSSRASGVKSRQHCFACGVHRVNIFSVFFFLSGFCSLVYQVVWLRLAMADFGVVTPLVSIVLSVFMAGLALGSWGGGRLVRRLRNRSGGFFIRLYGVTELAIGISGLVVAPLLSVGRSLL